MFTVSLKQTRANDLANVLNNIVPSALKTLKELNLVSKSADRFTDAFATFLAVMAEIKNGTAEFNAKIDKDSTKEEIEAVKIEANIALKSVFERQEAIADEIVSVELSDEQVEFLRANFMDLIAKSFKTVGYALEIAEALEVDLDK